MQIYGFRRSYSGRTLPWWGAVQGSQQCTHLVLVEGSQIQQVHAILMENNLMPFASLTAAGHKELDLRPPTQDADPPEGNFGGQILCLIFACLLVL